MHAAVPSTQGLVVLCNTRYISHSLFLTLLKCKGWEKKKFIKNCSIKKTAA